MLKENLLHEIIQAIVVCHGETQQWSKRKKIRNEITAYTKFYIQCIHTHNVKNVNRIGKLRGYISCDASDQFYCAW